MNWIFLLLALIAGMSLPAQGAINSKLADYLQSPMLAVFFSFVTGATALLVYILISRIPLGPLSMVRSASPIALTGGILGAIFVTLTTLAVPRLGVALTFSLVILGQMIATIPIDHYGLLGVAQRAITLPRVIGALLIVAGAILIRRY